jgi:hypothetical protein
MKKLLVGLLMIPAMAHAEFWTGNDLLKYMNGTPMEQVQGYGYVMGVFDTAAGVDHCGQNAGRITVGQINDIAKRYIENNPSTRHYAADVLVRVAFGITWPCPKSNNKGGRGA